MSSSSTQRLCAACPVRIHWRKLHFEDSELGTGTHDNETMEGWLKDSATKKDKTFIQRYLGINAIKDVSWLMIREAFKSVSRTSIVMMQAGTSALSYQPLLSQHFRPMQRDPSDLRTSSDISAAGRVRVIGQLRRAQKV